MSEGMEKLRSIGAQKIHEQTHIAHKYVQSLLHESFDGMQKVQLMGFISILEREYDVDLSDLRHKAEEYFSQDTQIPIVEEPSYKKELLTSKVPNMIQKKYLYAGIAGVAVVLLAVWIFFAFSAQENQKPKKSQMPAKQSAVVEVNATEQNSSTKQESIPQKPKEQKKEHTFRILPKTKVWVGIIDLDKQKKMQKITANPIDLNGSKLYLLTFGHGYISFDIDGKEYSYKDPKKVKFLYRDGKIQKLTNDEFRSYNKGRLW